MRPTLKAWRVELCLLKGAESQGSHTRETECCTDIHHQKLTNRGHSAEEAKPSGEYRNHCPKSELTASSQADMEHPLQRAIRVLHISQSCQTLLQREHIPGGLVCADSFYHF